MEIACIVLTVLSEGDRLVALIVTLKDARSEIEERVAKIQSHWLRTQAQLTFAKHTWVGLSEEHRENQLSILRRLHSKVKSAEHRVQGLIMKRTRATNTANPTLRIRRMKYLFVKPYLDSLINDLVQWQALYDPTWYLIMRIAKPLIDTELKRNDCAVSSAATVVLRSARKVRHAISRAGSKTTHVFLSPDRLEEPQMSRIAYCKAMLLSLADSTTPVLVDSIPCPSYASAGITITDIRRLASKLSVVDPAIFGVLKCRRVVKWPPKNEGRITSFEMTFETPSAHKPRTLRQYLAAPQGHSLTDRITLAKRLASSVNFVHTLDFVHKNVRPENIVNFESTDEPKLGNFYLIGFEHVRSENGRTYLRGSENWEQNIYRHPDRQGSHPEERYTMQHDIYSLGVCLLEIGLWTSFIKYGESEAILGPGEVLELTSSDLGGITSSGMKDHLVMLAKFQLPFIVGDSYTEVMLSCLTCLDTDNDDYGDVEDEEDADGVVMGVKFIEEVLLKLNGISI